MNNNYNYGTIRQPSSNIIMPDITGINDINMQLENKNIFAEDILAKNKGKFIKVYMSFGDSIEWCDRIFEGNLEAWGKDFILLYDKRNNKRYMVWNLYIDFIEFNEEVNI